MPDDIATYLLLDECVLARCRSSRPKGWDLSDPSKWVTQVLIFVDDVVYAPAVTSTPRFLLSGVVAILVFVTAGIVWYWASTARFIESTDDAYVGGEITTLSAKVAGFIQTVAVVDNQAIQAGDLLLKLEDRDYRRSSPEPRRASRRNGRHSPISRPAGACTTP
jgi:Biotin-lipoyl like